MLNSNAGKLNYLRWFDIVVLTVIFWGSGIWTSTLTYIELCKGTIDYNESMTFTAADNYAALYEQLVMFIIALLYLFIRRFNFRQWVIRLDIKAICLGVIFFIAGALIQDMYIALTDTFSDSLPFPSPIGDILGNETVSEVIYAIFNGVYEELYFLGICLAVRPKYIKWALVFSLLVRISFHTYQGMISAIGIGVVFGVYVYLLYAGRKDKNLVPFFVAHAIADVFGLGILWYIGL